MTHNSEKPFICSKCDRSFKTTVLLNAHHKRKHPSSSEEIVKVRVKQYTEHHGKHDAVSPPRVQKNSQERECRMCDVEFETPADLRQHLRVSSDNFF